MMMNPFSFDCPIFQPTDDDDDNNTILPLLLVIDDDDDDDDILEVTMLITLYLIKLNNGRYHLTPDDQEATHYAYIEGVYAWAMYMEREEGWSKEELARELGINRIRLMVRKRKWHWERELDDLLSFEVRFERKGELVEGEANDESLNK